MREIMGGVFYTEIIRYFIFHLKMLFEVYLVKLKERKVFALFFLVIEFRPLPALEPLVLSSLVRSFLLYCWFSI